MRACLLTEARRSDVHGTQGQRILRLLQDAQGEWISALELSQISLQYSARVRELRVSGHPIENKTLRANRKKYGYFRLPTAAMKRALAALRPAPAPEPELSKDDEPTLFDIGKERTHRDDN